MVDNYTVRAVIEILGSPQEHVENTMKIIAQKLKDHTILKNVTTKLYPTKEAPLKDEKGNPLQGLTKGKTLWTSFCECEFDIDDIDVLFGFCFDFMPSSVEIIKPEKLKFDVAKMNNLLNDLASRLHYYDMIVKQLRIKNTILEKKLGLNQEKKE